MSTDYGFHLHILLLLEAGFDRDTIRRGLHVTDGDIKYAMHWARRYRWSPQVKKYRSWLDRPIERISR